MTEEEKRLFVLECNQEILRLIKNGENLTYRSYRGEEEEIIRRLRLSSEEVRYEDFINKAAQEMNYYHRDKNE